MPWVRATCSKKWLFGGSLCHSVVLGTNRHTWLSSKVMGMRWHPQCAGAFPWVPHLSTPRPRTHVLCEVRDPRLSLLPLQGTPNTALATEASLQGIVC